MADQPNVFEHQWRVLPPPSRESLYGPARFAVRVYLDIALARRIDAGETLFPEWHVPDSPLSLESW